MVAVERECSPHEMERPQLYRARLQVSLRLVQIDVFHVSRVGRQVKSDTLEEQLSSSI